MRLPPASESVKPDDMRRTHDTKKSASPSGDNPIDARNAFTGYRSPNDDMNSHAPLPATSSTVSRASRSSVGWKAATEAGANQRFMTWRYFMCSGGSTNDGRNRYAGSGSVATMEWFENVSGDWNASRMSSNRVSTQKPGP